MLATTTTIIENDCRLVVCNDPYNKRIRIDDIQGNVQTAIEYGEQLADEKNAEKLIFKGRREQFDHFLEKGFIFEGKIDNYFLGSDCYFFCKYFSNERRNSLYICQEDGILQNVQQRNIEKLEVKAPDDYILKRVTEKDAQALAELYRTVFEIYPTPLHEPDYIKKTLEEGTVYYAFFKDGLAVSAASAEINPFYKNAELTDCATLPEHRKFGLLKILLIELEKYLFQSGVYCSYSLARALSFGMNRALQQLGYHYQGRLINNCYIFDKIENMNIWVKNLAADKMPKI